MAAAATSASDGCYILVSGYPPYTQPQDLTRVFSKFGSVKVDRISNRMACLLFKNDDEAKEAIDASEKVNVYGEFLKVKPYDAEEENKPQTPKRDFPRSKQQTGAVPEPASLELTGPFAVQLERALAGLRLSAAAVQQLGRLYADLEAALRPQWPGCTAVPFGSITTGLGTKASDADCFIRMAPEHREHHSTCVMKAKRVLQQYPKIFAEILAIPRANTPIVKFFHLPTATNCDVTFKTPLGAQNSKLVAFLMHADPRLVPMAVLLKYWAKIHEFSGTGKLTNYALTLLIIFYLQQPPISILPAVAWLQRDRKYDVFVDFWNTGFMNQKDLLPASTNTSSISELLGGFFEYYASFDFEEMIVSPFLGSPMKKQMFKDPTQLPHEFELYKMNVLHKNTFPLRFTTPMCVQDPYEQCHNVASPITSRLASDIKAYFKFAANAYEKEKLNDCEGFLRTILLEKPKIIRAKTHPEYKINIYSRMIRSIVEPEWKPVLRDLVRTVFENMLLIPLEKMELKPNPESKREKDKFAGTLTNAVWRRKQFYRLYTHKNMRFEERQRRISEEVLAVEKEPVNIQFHLTLTYNHQPKTAIVVVRLVTGDLDTFREFGKFYTSILQPWITELHKSTSRVEPEKDGAIDIDIADTIKGLDSHLTINDSDDDSSPLESSTHLPPTC